MIQSWDDRASLHVTFSFFNPAFKAGKNKSFFASIGLLLMFYPSKSLWWDGDLNDFNILMNLYAN